MANQVLINPGTTTPIRTDSQGTIETQVIKLDISAAGTTGNPWDGKLQGGTVSVNMLSGTLNVGTVSIGNINSIGTLNSGTITKVEGGSIVVTAGTIATGSVVVTAGTVNITAGSVLAYGGAGSAVAVVGAPVYIGGQGGNGTLYPLAVDTAGQVKAVVTLGTGIVTSGSIAVIAGTGVVTGGSIVVTAGTVVAGTLTNLTSGTINAATAVLNSGTINVATAVVSSLPNLPQGSINVTAGTGIITNGSIVVTAGTVVNNGGSAIAYGPAGSAVAVAGNPVYIGGQGGNGTVYPLLTDVTGKQMVVMSVGTIGAGTVAVSAGTVTAGTLTNLISGTINSATAVLNSGTINVATAVISSLPNLPQGSINVTAGTITAGSIIVTAGTAVGKDANAAAQSGNPLAVGGTDSGGTIRTVNVDSTGALKVVGASAGTYTNMVTGTLNVGTVTVTSGSVAVTAGTVMGKDANAAAQTGNPISIGGTDSGGTVRTVLVNSSGALSVTGASAGTYVNLVTGTLNVGTVVMTVGTISSLPNLPGGSIVVTAGTVVGKDANAAAQSGNPVAVGGTDSGGTIRTANVDSTGALKVVGASAGTYTNMVTGTLNVGTVTAYGGAGSAVAVSGNPLYIAGQGGNGTIYPILTDTTGKVQAVVTAGTGIVTGGSIVVTTGTIVAGTLTNLVSGTINSATAVLNSGTINVATAVVSSLPNLPQGSINVTAGTVYGGAGSAIAVSGNPVYVAGQGGNGTVYPILTDTTGKIQSVVTAGTVAVSAGTMIMTAGTVAAGTIAVSAGTITHGTIDAGTVKLDGRASRNIVSYGTTFAGTAAAYGTLVGSAVVGAGTSLWVNDVSIVNSKGGTITCLVGFGTVLNGTSVLVKGDFGPQQGIQKSYPLAVNAGMTNQDLVCYVGAAGTIDVNVSYFISA